MAIFPIAAKMGALLKKIVFLKYTSKYRLRKKIIIFILQNIFIKLPIHIKKNIFLAVFVEFQKNILFNFIFYCG